MAAHARVDRARIATASADNGVTRLCPRCVQLSRQRSACHCAELAQQEAASGEWVLAQQLSPFSSLGGRSFPVVLSFMAHGAPARSALPPAVVREHLAVAFL